LFTQLIKPTGAVHFFLLLKISEKVIVQKLNLKKDQPSKLNRTEHNQTFQQNQQKYLR